MPTYLHRTLRFPSYIPYWKTDSSSRVRIQKRKRSDIPAKLFGIKFNCAFTFHDSANKFRLLFLSSKMRSIPDPIFWTNKWGVVDIRYDSTISPSRIVLSLPNNVLFYDFCPRHYHFHFFLLLLSDRSRSLVSRFPRFLSPFLQDD